MTGDLTTLLRDAGRGPTTGLDVDAVHSRGRRRAVGRRVALGAGALAMLGVLGAGITTLLDTPDAPLIDQAPNEDAAPALTDSLPVVTRTALAAELGRDVHLHRSVGGSTWQVERTTPAGHHSRHEHVIGAAAAPVIGMDAYLLYMDASGALLAEEDMEFEPPGSWLLPLWAESGPRMLVVELEDGGAPSQGTPDLRVIESDLVDSSTVDELADVEGSLPPGARVQHADMRQGRVVVTGRDATNGVFAVLVQRGVGARDLTADPAVASLLVDGRIGDVAFVADEVWIAVTVADGATSAIVRVPVGGGGEARLLPLPIEGTGFPGRVTALAASDDGSVVLVGRAGVDGDLRPLVVRPAQADALADGGINLLDAVGVPTIVAASPANGR